ncbi:DNA-directed RNA polymerase subunit H [Candidatus Marsarchaeota archaeon]|nr:DNA-directed RNA polymerase subunit H [Candidatus Marsarchaeota archaeon]
MLLVGEPLVFGEDLLVKHELLSESEAKAVSKKFGTQLDKFPKISVNDPQVKKLNAQPGNLIAIYREDPNSSYTYYRYVVKEA